MHVLSLAIKALLHSYKVVLLISNSYIINKFISTQVFDGLLSDSEFTSVRHVSVVPDVISLAVLVSGALHIVSFGGICSIFLCIDFTHSLSVVSTSCQMMIE